MQPPTGSLSSPVSVNAAHHPIIKAWSSTCISQLNQAYSAHYSVAILLLSYCYSTAFLLLFY